MAKQPRTQPDLDSKLRLSYIPALDGLRAAAVFLVVFYHFGYPHVPGATGVTAFFVLSGFLITWLLIKESGRTGTISFRSFYRRRALRIFPAFYAYAIIAITIQICRHHPIDWKQTIAALAYTENYYQALVPAHGEHFLAHSWSLAIEEQFYLLWPCVFFLFRANLQRLARVLAIFIGFLWLYRAMLCAVFAVRESYLYHAFDTRVDQLLVGCLLAILVYLGHTKWLVNRLCAKAYYPLVTVGVLGLVVYGPFLPKYLFRFTIGFALEPLIIAIFIIQLVVFSDHPGWRLVNHPLLRYLGRISYPIYLWQQLTLFTARRLTSSYNDAVQLLVAVSVTLAFAAASYHLLEQPILRLRTRATSQDRKTGPAHKAAALSRPQ